MVSSFNTPAYFNGTIYFVGGGPLTSDLMPGGEQLKALTLVGGMLSTTPTVAPRTYGYPGSTPSISANGTTSGIVWTLDNGGWSTYQPAVLIASDARDITHVLYASSAASGGVDAAGPAVKFTVPTVANGHVYVAGNGMLTAYGLLGPH
jgi:hypothetical protein